MLGTFFTSQYNWYKISTFPDLAEKVLIQEALNLDAVVRDLLKPGGFVTTTQNNGQQWDAPNGWAPLEWVSIKGLRNYYLTEEANTAADHWIKLNTDVYNRTGKMMEKYNVVDKHLEAGGGEHPSPDGFGWTNEVLPHSPHSSHSPH
jgi:neutral trehalase